MKNYLSVFLLLPALLALLPADAPGAELARGSEEANAGISVQGWLSAAEAKWQISFPYATRSTNPGIPVGTAGTMESELKFKRIDSPITVVTGGGGITPRISFDVMFGYGLVARGRDSDTDRFVYDGGRKDYSVSQSDLDGDVRMVGLNFYYNYSRFDFPKRGAWGLVVGYLHYADRFMMTNGYQAVSQPFEGSYYPSVGPFEPSMVLNSSFDFTWDTVKVGVTRQAALRGPFGYEAILSVYPYVSYHGEGYWNLRAGSYASNFRTESPNFVQKAPWGYGYEAQLGLTYDISGHVGLAAGYRYLFLRAMNGLDTVYFADGSSSDTNLDWATVTRQGAFAEALLRF